MMHGQKNIKPRNLVWLSWVKWFVLILLEIISLHLYTPIVILFLYRRFGKIAKSNYRLRHVCPSARNNSVPTGWIFMKFDFEGFSENLSRKSKFY